MTIAGLILSCAGLGLIFVSPSIASDLVGGIVLACGLDLLTGVGGVQSLGLDRIRSPWLRRPLLLLAFLPVLAANLLLAAVPVLRHTWAGFLSVWWQDGDGRAP